MSDSARPAHHGPDGRFRIPWPLEVADQRSGGVLRWQWERMRQKRAPNPRPDQVPLVPHAVAQPRAADGEIRITWVGHASFLIQAGGLNLLTDPHWSRRASPSQRIGPARFQQPGIPFDELPPIDAVLLSHDHYDHLDRATVQRLHARFGDALRWITPLAYRAWFADLGVMNVTELDWWDETDAGAVRVVSAPAQHWTRRRLKEMNDRLWASYALLLPDGRRIYWGGDSGYFRGYGEIGRRLGPFPDTHPTSVRTELAMRAGALLKSGTPDADVRQALSLWLDKPKLGPATLPSLVSEVVRNRSRPAAAAHAEGAATTKARGWLDVANQLDPAVATAAPSLSPPHPRAIEP